MKSCDVTLLMLSRYFSCLDNIKHVTAGDACLKRGHLKSHNLLSFTFYVMLQFFPYRLTCDVRQTQKYVYCGFCRELIFRYLPSNKHLISDNSQVRKYYFLIRCIKNKSNVTVTQEIKVKPENKKSLVLDTS